MILVIVVMDDVVELCMLIDVWVVVVCVKDIDVVMCYYVFDVVVFDVMLLLFVKGVDVYCCNW